jgi:hypothetical protein
MADTFDIAAFRTADGQLAAHVMVDALSSGETVTGEAKLAQRVIIELLTDKGSMPFAPTRGTNLVGRLRSGRVRTEHDLFVAFAAAGIDLARNLHSEESTSDLPSSRYDRSKLLALKLSPADGMAELLIEITSRAGTKVGLQLPVNVKL